MLIPRKFFYIVSSSKKDDSLLHSARSLSPNWVHPEMPGLPCGNGYSRLTLAEHVPRFSRGVCKTKHRGQSFHLRRLHEAGCKTALEPWFMDPDPRQDHPGLGADLLVFGIDGQP